MECSFQGLCSSDGNPCMIYTTLYNWGYSAFFLGVSDGSYQLTKWNAHPSRPFFMSHILSNAFSELDEELTYVNIGFFAQIFRWVQIRNARKIIFQRNRDSWSIVHFILHSL